MLIFDLPTLGWLLFSKPQAFHSKIDTILLHTEELAGYAGYHFIWLSVVNVINKDIVYNIIHFEWYGKIENVYSQSIGLFLFD